MIPTYENLRYDEHDETMQKLMELLYSQRTILRSLDAIDQTMKEQESLSDKLAELKKQSTKHPDDIDAKHPTITMDAVLFFAMLKKLQDYVAEEERRGVLETQADNLRQRGVTLRKAPDELYGGMSYATPKDLVDSEAVNYVSLSGIASAAEDNDIPSLHVGDRTIYAASAVAQLIQHQDAVPVPEPPKKRGRPPGRRNSYKSTQPPRKRTA